MLRSALYFSLALAMATPALAKKSKKPTPPEDGLPSVEQVSGQVKVVYDELIGNSDPLVRRSVFTGMLALGGETAAKAVEQGLKDGDWEIQGKALELALAGKNKVQRKAAQGALAKLLESADEVDRDHGYALLAATAKSPKAIIAATQIAAKDGSPAARADGRKRLVAVGGKPAWSVIEKGFAETPDQPEYKEAVEAMKAFSGPEGIKWAVASIQDSGPIGVLARDYLVRLKGGKAVAKMDKNLGKTYDKSADFETRLRLANVLGRRGQAAKVQRTLLAGLKFKKPGAKQLSWVAFSGQRDLALLGKLRERIVTLNDADEAEAAFAWLVAWGKETGEAKVFEILQEIARGDRRELRLRGMQALATLKHRKSMPLFESAMSEGQVQVRLAAAQGIAAVARPGDEKRIAKFLRKEPDPNVKLSLIEGLAQIGTPEIIDSLQFVVTARQPEMKMAAAKAVAKTGKPKAALLLGLLKRDADVNVRFFAWHNLLKLKPTETQKQFKSAMAWLTAEQVETLGADKAVPNALLEMIALRGNDDQRPFAVDALSTRKAVTALLGIFEKSKEADTASAALTGLAAVRQAQSVATYRKGMEHRFGPVRASAFHAIGLFGPRALLEQVLGGLADREPLARAAAANAAFLLAGRTEG